MKNGKSGGVDDAEIIVRYFAQTNPQKRFFMTQGELNAAVIQLSLDTSFPSTAGLRIPKVAPGLRAQVN